jgi:hypothetical protein
MLWTGKAPCRKEAFQGRGGEKPSGVGMPKRHNTLQEYDTPAKTGSHAGRDSATIVALSRLLFPKQIFPLHISRKAPSSIPTDKRVKWSMPAVGVDKVAIHAIRAGGSEESPLVCPNVCFFPPFQQGEGMSQFLFYMN